MNKLLQKITVITVIAMFSCHVNAQGLKFGPRYDKMKIQRVMKKAQQAKASTSASSVKKSAPVIDEWASVDDDTRYRYVFGYNTDLMRTSETIYKSTRGTDGTWGSESLLTVGTYTYEYNTSGQLKKKTVNYTANDDFDSYYIEVEYESNGIVAYKKYELDSYDNTYELVMAWKNYANGQLAELEKHDPYLYTEYTKYDENGSRNYWQYGERFMQQSGELNDSIVTGGYVNSSSSAINYHYKYDSSIGRLLEYTDEEEHDEYDRYLFTYDSFGRISKIEMQGTVGDDDVDVGYDDGSSENGYGVKNKLAKIHKSADGEKEYETEYSVEYTYFNDEAYECNNTWYAVFGMEGPLSSVVVNDEGFIYTITFTRNADGTLTAGEYSFPTDENRDMTGTITIDGEGHITEMKTITNSTYDYDYDANGDGVDNDYGNDTEENTSTYIWTDGVVTQKIYDESYYGVEFGYEYSGGYTDKTDYTYTDNGYSAKNYDSEYDGEKGSGYEVATEIKKPNYCGKSILYYNSDGELVQQTRLRCAIQEKDVKFVRPEVIDAYDGFSYDSLIVASVAGRVAVIKYTRRNSYDNSYSYGLVNDVMDYDTGEFYYCTNMNEDNWFTIEEENGQTICDDVYNRPIYVLEDSRLVAEYVYMDEDYSTGEVSPDVSGEESQAKRASSTDGLSYKKITYTYNEDGYLSGKSITTVDSDGTTTEEIVAEYVYDTSTVITDINVSTNTGTTLDGRTLSIGNGASMTIFTTDGRILASGVSSYTLPSAGLYIIKTGKTTVKVVAK